jgi:aryl-alcohol dehydrogenase-like predicted oxidoreductase
MKLVDLGRTGMKVSEICLGTMTWGSQNSEAEGHAQMDCALGQGVNFWDTAEMYPVPPDAKYAGRTEEIIGTWFAARGRRDRVVLATKLAGGGQPAVRAGAWPDAASMRAAVEGSLRRLQTDYIDLYQLHWPARAHYHFRQSWTFDPRKTDPVAVRARMLELLQEAGRLVAEGKIRAFGLSNESTWGTMEWLRLAAEHGLPRVASVQNEYSLMCRQFDTDWAEVAQMEDIPLLAFSPLATGLLSGKYQGDVIPEGTRRVLNPALGGRMGPRTLPTVQVYLDIAAKHGLDPCQMAIAFTLSRPFPCIPIIGASSMDQLRVNLGQVVLSPEVLRDIEAAHRAHPMPY